MVVKKNSRYEVITHRKIFDDFFKKRGYKQLPDMYEEMAEYAGVSPSTIGQIRLKGLAPSYIVGIKLAEFMEVNPTDIWEVKEMETPEVRSTCIVEGCDRIGTTKGYCMKHVGLSKEVKK